MSESTTLDRPDVDTTSETDLAFAEILKNNDVAERDDSGDHDLFSHYVNKEDIVASALNRTPVRAVCGKVWTPSKSPEKLPICPECKDVYEQMQPGE